MALVKPIINEIVAFDASIGTTITFTANGGDQVVKNEIKIVSNKFVQGYYNSEDELFYNDDTFSVPIVGDFNTIYIGLNTGNNYLYDGSIFYATDITELVVYQNTVNTYSFIHEIPPNELQNGEYYRIAVRTYDILNNASLWSNYQPFYCFTTPILSLNITSGQTITTANFGVVLGYYQIEGEKVDYAIIDLYNHNNILVNSSGNLYNSNYPPINFEYGLLGLENHSQYYIKATVVTLYGTVIQTDSILFYTNYDITPTSGSLTATLDSCNGYVNLHSNIIHNIYGESNPQIPTYINNQKIDLLSTVADINNPNSYYAVWNHNLFTIPTDFLFRLWFYPARTTFECVKITNDDDSAYITISFQRSSSQDYLCIRTDNGTVIDQPLGVICNSNTKVFLWMKVVGNTWTVQTDILENPTTHLNWNESSTNNSLYNATSGIAYTNEAYGTYVASSSVYNALSGELTKIVIGNGIFDHMNVTTDTSISYTTTIPDWDDDTTILNANFNGNLLATPSYTKLVLKRKDSSLLNWINLSEIQVQPNQSAFINFNDSFIPTGITQEYALVIYLDNVPSDYITVEVTPQWGKYFLSDKDNRFPLNYAVIYSNHVQNIQNGVFMPISATYPIVVQNGEGNYRSGSLQFKVLGYQFEEDKTLDRVSMTKQLDDMLKFLTNGKAKCLTDFNGNIFIIKVVNSPQISYDANYGNSIPTISFDWVEQGKYNDYDTMLELGLFDYIE